MHRFPAILAAAVVVAAGGRSLNGRDPALSLQSARFEVVQPDLFGAGASLTNAWADYDADGDPDLFVGFNGAPNRLYRNDQGVFTDAAADAGVADARATRAAAWGDIDGDGDPDLVVGFTPQGGAVLKAYRNEGGRFRDATAEWAMRADSGAVRQISILDYDGDGDTDVFVAFRDRANALFRNESGRFTDVAGSIGLDDTRRSVGAVWFDADEDGDLDLYVANMDGDANGFFRNDGARFVDVAGDIGVAWGGRAPRETTNGTVRPCVADVDGDGHLDLFMANYGKNGLFLNRGGRFEDASARFAIDIDSRYDTCAFADYDNDGHLDYYVNGTVTGGVSYADHLYRNEGSRYTESTPPELAAIDGDHGVQWADFDGDGDLDLALTASASTSPHPLLRNLLEATARTRSLSIVVRDSAGHRSLAGAEIRVYEAGRGRLIGTRLIDSGSGYNSQNVLPVHVGLGAVSRVDVRVVMPNGGRRAVAELLDVAVPATSGRVLTVDLPMPRSRQLP